MIKTNCILILSALIIIPAHAQNLLSGPETIVFDSLNNRYLVSNMNSPYYIIAIDMDGNQSIFNSEMVWPHGMTIVGDTLFVATNRASNGGIVGFDLTTGDRIYEEMRYNWYYCVNSVTADTSGNLYFSCGYSSVYRLQISDGTSYLLASSFFVPNGVYFDAPNNRVILAEEDWGSDLFTFDATDYSMSTIPFTYGRFSGVTADNDNNLFVSAFWEGEIYKFDAPYSGVPELILDGLNGPEGICYNKRDNILAVPLLLDNRIEYFSFNDPDLDDIPDYTDNCPDIYNPGQDDSDGDGIGDLCDICAGYDDTLDDDEDSVPDGCNACPGFDDFADLDDDEVPNGCDNCPDDFNPDQLDTDEDDVGDVCDWICGDTDGDELVNILDIVYLINYKYKSGPAPAPLKSADVNHDSLLNILDVVYLINSIYKSGPEPLCTA